MKKTQNFLNWNNNVLISSLKKINLNIILIIVLDTIFYLLSGYLIVFWLQRMQERLVSFNLPSDIISLGPEKAQALASEARAFYYFIIFSFILLILTIIFLASMLKGIIWAKTTNTKITFALISKFLALNLVWMSFWFALAIIISLFVEVTSAPAFMLTAIILGIYFTNTLYAIFMKKPTIKSVISAVKLNILKAHLFLLPYVIIFLLFFIIAIGSKNLQMFNTIYILSIINLQNLIITLILILYAAVVRHYISTLVFEAETY